MKRQITPNRVLIPIGLGLALSLLGDQTLYTVLPSPEIAAQVGISMAWVGVVLGINRFTRIFTNGPAGYLYDRYPRRGLMIAAISLGALSTLIYVFGGGIGLLIIGRILWGISWSGIWVGSNIMALDISDPHNRGKINGLLYMWFFLGVAFSSFAGGLFTDLFGYRGGLLVSSILTACGILLWVFLLPETRPDVKRPQVNSQKNKGFANLPWRTTLGIAVPFFSLRFVFAGVLASTTILWLGQHFDGGLRIPGLVIPLATLTGSFVAVRVLVSVIGAPVIGALSDRLGDRWAVLAGILAIGAGCLWLMSVQEVSLAIIGATLATAASGGAQGLIPAILGDRIHPTQQSRALGMVFSLGDFGSAIGPLVALALVPLLGVSALYKLCAVLFGLVFLFAGGKALSERKGKLAGISSKTP